MDCHQNSCTNCPSPTNHDLKNKGDYCLSSTVAVNVVHFIADILQLMVKLFSKSA